MLKRKRTRSDVERKKVSKSKGQSSNDKRLKLYVKITNLTTKQFTKGSSYLKKKGFLFLIIAL